MSDPMNNIFQERSTLKTHQEADSLNLFIFNWTFALHFKMFVLQIKSRAWHFNMNLANFEFQWECSANSLAWTTVWSSTIWEHYYFWLGWHPEDTANAYGRMTNIENEGIVGRLPALQVPQIKPGIQWSDRCHCQIALKSLMRPTTRCSIFISKSQSNPYKFAEWKK